VSQDVRLNAVFSTELKTSKEKASVAMVYRTTAKMADRKANRRRKLLESAALVFGLHGYHAATVPMIVAASESSTGSFYFYFRSKEDIFAAVIEDLGREISAVLTEAVGKSRTWLAQDGRRGHAPFPVSRRPSWESAHLDRRIFRLEAAPGTDTEKHCCKPCAIRGAGACRSCSRAGYARSIGRGALLAGRGL
jgi:AcrR family transcriptional regulator